MKCNTDCTGGSVVWLQLTLISRQAEPLFDSNCNYSSVVLIATESPCKILTLQNYVLNMNRYSQCFLYNSSVQTRIDFLLLLIVAVWLAD